MARGVSLPEGASEGVVVGPGVEDGRLTVEKGDAVCVVAVFPGGGAASSLSTGGGIEASFTDGGVMVRATSGGSLTVFSADGVKARLAVTVSGSAAEPTGEPTTPARTAEPTGEPEPARTAEPASTPTSDPGVVMHRLYNPNSGEHFYTASDAERDNLVGAGWRYEGIGWVAPTEGEDVYRLYNPNAGDHHYTLSAAEKSRLVSLGWRDEGAGWKSGGSLSVLREYNPNAQAGAHNFTLSAAEDAGLASAGWTAEGMAWSALRQPTAGEAAAADTAVARVELKTALKHGLYNRDYIEDDMIAAYDAKAEAGRALLDAGSTDAAAMRKAAAEIMAARNAAKESMVGRLCNPKNMWGLWRWVPGYLPFIPSLANLADNIKEEEAYCSASESNQWDTIFNRYVEEDYLAKYRSGEWTKHEMLTHQLSSFNWGYEYTRWV